MYYEPWEKIHDYIKEVEIWPVDDIEMSNDDVKNQIKQLSSSSPDKEMQSSESIHSKNFYKFL